MFGGRKGRAAFSQSSPEEWRQKWQSLVPPECRDVPVTVGEKTEIAFVQENHFAMMLQDGLLMEASFFPVCQHFQRAGYRVIWLMRCTQDIENGFLRRRKALRDGGFLWDWRSPTTNFGRWTSDNRYVTILLQHRPLPEGAEPLQSAGSRCCSGSAGRRAPTPGGWSPGGRGSRLPRGRQRPGIWQTGSPADS